MLNVLLIALVAGSVGTLIGGALGVVIKTPSKNYIGMMLGFAAGTMLGVSLFELLPESYENGGIFASAIGVMLGVLFVWIIDVLFHNDCKHEIEEESCNRNFCVKEKRGMSRMGVIIFIAITLHGLPEGVAIGAGEHIGIGLLLGIVLLLHSIPEGIAFALPLKAAGTKTWKVLVYSFCAGLPMVLGALIGYFVGYTDIMVGYALSFAAGAMLYVVLAQMLPIAYRYTKHSKWLAIITVLGAIVIIVFSTILH